MAKRTVNGPKIDGLELRAAAAAAYVVGGRAQRRDLGGSRMRDFDLRYPDGRADEPLEITSFVDRAGLETWKRVGRKDPIASMVSRVWTLDMPSREQGPDSLSGPGCCFMHSRNVASTNFRCLDRLMTRWCRG